MRSFIIIFCALIVVNVSFSQENYYNQGRHMQFANPSSYGLNGQSFAGFGYNTFSIKSNEKIDSKIFYGAIGFNDANFSLGVDFNNFQINSYGLTQNTVNVSYIYHLEIGRSLYLLPSLSIGFGSHTLQSEDLIFGDQLDLLTGSIFISSNDPLSLASLNNNFFDFSASMLLYNEHFLVGVAIKHLNQPDLSYTKEFEFKRPISFSLQVAYERDINYYGRGFLPENSYLFLYNSITSVGDLAKIYAGQDLILGGFSIGFHELYTKNKLSSALLLGLNTRINVDEFEFNFSYNIPVYQDVAFPPSVFELSMIIKFDRFLRNNSGYFKRLKIEGF